MACKTGKLSIFFNIKDSISVEQTFNVICRITCPGYFQKYVGKTHQNLVTRLEKDDTKVDQPMYQHLSNYSAFNDHIMLLHFQTQLLIAPLAKPHTFIMRLLITLKV